VDDGLEWLAEHGLVDMLAIVHRHFNIIDRLFVSSHTKHIASHSQLPLLVFPGHEVPFVLPVF
jgi:nucleotide-binding universal stress UspA family protein